MNKEETKILNKNNSKNNFQSFLSIVWLIFVRLFSSPTTLVFMFIPFIFIFSYVIVVPLYYSGTIVLNFSLLSSTFFIYGIFFFNIRKSTIYNSISLNFSSKKGKLNIYGAILILILIFNFIFSNFIISILLVINNFFNLDSFAYPVGKPIMMGLYKTGDNYLFDFTSSYSVRKYFIFSYYVFLTTIVTFAISFVFQGLTHSFKGYMILSVIYILITIIFGSTLSSNFNGLPTGTYYLDGTTYLNPTFVIDASDLESFYQDSSGTWHFNIYLQQVFTETDELGNKSYFAKSFSNNSSDILWWMSQIVPQNFINEFFFSTWLDISYDSTKEILDGTKSSLIFIDNNNVENIVSKCEINVSYFKFKSITNVYIFIMPYIFLVIFFILGGFINNYEK